MTVKTNPFHELYAGDSVNEEQFVDLFSDVIVKHALSLFQPGHVILKGLRGSGKTMLLNLLKPAIRVAYERKQQKFPVPDQLSRFVGAGINLIKSGIASFGQRPIGDKEYNKTVSPIYFGDFLNYWLVADIFLSIRKLSSESELARKIGISNNEQNCNLFATKLSHLDCWFGYLDNVTDFKSLEKRISERIIKYRAFLNYSVDDLPQEIHESKTIIGVPVSKTVQLLKEFGIIESDTEVYIRIDQYEELASLDESIQGLGASYREMIHKLLNMRDSNVSYRIGTRYFSWTGEEKVYGSAAILEKNRNYTDISIDLVFKRLENRRTWAFPEFAEDIFVRRLKQSSYKVSDTENLISEIFGLRDTPSLTAKRYVPNTPEKATLLENSWPDGWKKFLIELAQTDPLSARLGEAWARQKSKGEIVDKDNWPQPYEWENKRWWKKERIEQALMQIASRNNQRLIYYGKDDIMGLSGGHILIFLDICKHIWDVWIRDTRNEVIDASVLPKIDEVIQTAGIREASNDWYDAVGKVKGGKGRKVFIDYLGTKFFKTLVDDKAMSYPGWNGFSLTVADFEKNVTIYNFITDACNYGDLYDAPHTSKSTDKKLRRKFYLNPIFSPYFKIPYAHTKEPMYVNLQTVAEWLTDCGIFDRSDFPELFNGKQPKKKANKDDQGVIDF